MATNGSLTPPPDLSQLPHDSKQPDIIACVVLTWAFAFLTVCARFYTKIAISRTRLGASEWLLLAALVRVAPGVGDPEHSSLKD